MKSSSGAGGDGEGGSAATRASGKADDRHDTGSTGTSVLWNVRLFAAQFVVAPPETMGVVESAHVKVEMVRHVLDALITLLRTQAVLRAHTK